MSSNFDTFFQRHLEHEEHVQELGIEKERQQKVQDSHTEFNKSMANVKKDQEMDQEILKQNKEILKRNEGVSERIEGRMALAGDLLKRAEMIQDESIAAADRVANAKKKTIRSSLKLEEAKLALSKIRGR